MNRRKEYYKYSVYGIPTFLLANANACDDRCFLIVTACRQSRDKHSLQRVVSALRVFLSSAKRNVDIRLE